MAQTGTSNVRKILDVIVDRDYGGVGVFEEYEGYGRIIQLGVKPRYYAKYPQGSCGVKRGKILGINHPFGLVMAHRGEVVAVHGHQSRLIKPVIVIALVVCEGVEAPLGAAG